MILVTVANFASIFALFTATVIWAAAEGCDCPGLES
jgi:hypothetical protein